MNVSIQILCMEVTDIVFIAFVFVLHLRGTRYSGKCIRKKMIRCDLLTFNAGYKNAFNANVD